MSDKKPETFLELDEKYKRQVLRKAIRKSTKDIKKLLGLKDES